MAIEFKMPKHWEPHPKWPRHIIELALAVCAGIDAREMLYDALVEIGLQKTANNVLTDRLGVFATENYIYTRGVTIGYILNDRYFLVIGDREINQYLNKI